MKKVSVVVSSLIVVLGLALCSAPLNAQTQGNNPLVQKFVELFRGVNSTAIDDAVAKAKSQLNAEAEANQARRNNLERLFDSQIATLKDRGVPEQIVETLQNQKGTVLKKASEMTFEDGNIPFLPVIPRTFRSPYDLMAMVRNGGKAGYTYLNPMQISDVVDAPQEPYYIYDVEDGSSTRGRGTEKAEKIIKLQKQSPLTAAEVMALTTHTDVLSKHYVWATGSRYRSTDGVPCVCLDAGGRPRPRLGWSWAGSSSARWGSASCGSR